MTSGGYGFILNWVWVLIEVINIGRVHRRSSYYAVTHVCKEKS